MEEKKKLLLIINPVAGRAEVRHNLVPVLEIFESAGYMVTVFVTGKSGDASDIIIKHGKEYDLIVCSGGDGTISEVTTGIIKAGIYVPVGFMPAGSTNDCAAYHGACPHLR